VPSLTKPVGHLIARLRNFDYLADHTIVESLESRTVHPSKLRGLDYVNDALGGDLTAHPMLSFDFGSKGHVVLSIETRRENGKLYRRLADCIICSICNIFLATSGILFE